jgi:hypothetical protein
MRCLDSDSTCARLHMHVWAPLTSAGTCGGKGEGAENARLAWAEIASGSLHSTFTFFFSFFLNTVKTRRDRLKQPTFTVFCACGQNGPLLPYVPGFKRMYTREKKNHNGQVSQVAARRGLSRGRCVARRLEASSRARDAHRARVSTLDSLGDTGTPLADVSAPRGSRHTRRAGRAFVDNIDETKHRLNGAAEQTQVMWS